MRSPSEPSLFSWNIEDEISHLQNSLARECEASGRSVLEQQLQAKQQQLSIQLTREYQSAFTN